MDFADVRTIMGDAGTALMGIGRGSGKNRAQEAAAAAISSPLLDFPIEKVRAVKSLLSPRLTIALACYLLLPLPLSDILAITVINYLISSLPCLHLIPDLLSFVLSCLLSSSQAKGVVFNIVGGNDLTLQEVSGDMLLLLSSPITPTQSSSPSVELIW